MKALTNYIYYEINRLYLSFLISRPSFEVCYLQTFWNASKKIKLLRICDLLHINFVTLYQKKNFL